MDNQEKNSPASDSSKATSNPNNYPHPGTVTGITPQAKSNQTTTALIAVVIILLVIMLILSMNGKLSFGNNNSADLSSITSQNQAVRANLNAERARQGLPPLPENSQGALITAERIQRDATALVSLSKQWQNELNSKDGMIGGLQTELQSRDTITTSLYKQIAELQAKLDQAGNSSDQLLRISNELKSANTQIDSYRKQLLELQGRPSSDEVALLRQQLNTNMEERNKLQLQIDSLLTLSHDKVDSSELANLQEELAKIRPQYNSQRLEIQRLRALVDRGRLFVESENDLPENAQQLFAKLLTLENANEQQLLSAYQGIETSLNAEVAHRQTFAVSSSQITFDREKIIQDVLSKRRSADSYFLVVGYASKSGGAENNRKLSANRATTVASVVDTLKAANQDVKAVYLGETARFSSSKESENQLCEIWEIKK